MFDVDRDKPALVVAGDRVRFVPDMIEMLNTGIGSSFQDLGRPGLAHLGVGRSGAADRPSHCLANRLLGNDESAATIETCGGLSLRLHRSATVVVTGAEGQ